MARLRKALINAVTPEDLAAVIHTLVKKAKGGDLASIRELFDRTVGRPVEAEQVTAAAEPDQGTTTVTTDMLILAMDQSVVGADRIKAVRRRIKPEDQPSKRR